MGYSKISLCNMALLSLSQGAIESLEDGSAQANACRAFFDLCRRAVLREHVWNFATKTVELAQYSDYEPLDFAFAYALPADMVKLIGPVYPMYKGVTNTQGETVYNALNSIDGRINYKAVIKRIPYAVRALSNGVKAIFCDLDELFISYVYDVTDPNRFDDLFANCFRYMLAANIAFSVTGSVDLANAMSSAYRAALGEAKKADASEGVEEDTAGLTYIEARI